MTEQPRKTLLEVLTQDLELPEEDATKRLNRQIDDRRERAVRKMIDLRHQVDETIVKLQDVTDAGTWIWHARNLTGHAGYSNTMQANLAEALAELAQITGMIEAVA